MPRAAALFPLLLLIALAPGCSHDSGLSRRDPSGRLVLHFWNGFSGPDGTTMEALVRRFQEENPDLSVRMQIIPWGTYYSKLTLALAYGPAPDLFILHAERLPEFAAFDAVRPLDDLLATADPPLSGANFSPLPWQAARYGDRQYAIPLDCHTLGLYYNARLFREAGIVNAAGEPQPPADLQSFLESARRLTVDRDGDGRPDQWGFVFTWQRSNWLNVAAQFGADLLTSDGKGCGLESPGNLAALNLMRGLIYRERVAPKPEGIDAWLAFRQGKVGMAMEGIYQLASLEEQRGLEFGGAAGPQFGPRKAVWAGSHLLCQPGKIEPDRAWATWRLMRFLSNHSLEWARGGQLPVRLDLLRSPEFAAMRVQAAFARQLPYVHYEPPHPRINALFPLVDPAVEAVLLDLQTPEAAMQDACRRVEQVLRRP